MNEFTWEHDVLPIVRKGAKRYFCQRREADDRVMDAISLSWEMFQRRPQQATPTSLAFYAIRQAAVGRQFQQLALSIDGPPRSGERPVRTDFDPQLLFRTGDDPAAIVAAREAFWVWFASLGRLKQEVAGLLASGDRLDEAAAKCGLSRGRISQIRRELFESWTVFWT